MVDGNVAHVSTLVGTVTFQMDLTAQDFFALQLWYVLTHHIPCCVL